ncbi:MAG: hypothetical protein RI575_11285, partial [Balneolaceae bacterium]|nr:hypothetical protein [Balneolaceae bacterium]
MFDLRRFYLISLVIVIALCGITSLNAQEIAEPAVTDSLQDTVSTEDLRDAFPARYGNFAAKPFLRPIPAIYFITLPKEQVYVERREDGSFYAETRIGDVRSGAPSIFSSEQYYKLHEDLAKEENWKMLIREARQREVAGG